MDCMNEIKTEPDGFNFDSNEGENFMVDDYNINEAMEMFNDPSALAAFDENNYVESTSNNSSSYHSKDVNSLTESNEDMPDSELIRSSLKKKISKQQLLQQQDALLIQKDDSLLTEDELKIKKKAQNRAAQRAFRERKESKLNDLKSKLAQSELEKQELRRQLREFQNKQNKTTNEKNPPPPPPPSQNTIPETKFQFPKDENDFVDNLLGDSMPSHYKINRSKKMYTPPDSDGDKVLVVWAVWDYILYRVEEEDMELDIIEVMLKLKGHETCHGYGPAYSLKLIDSIIEQCNNAY